MKSQSKHNPQIKKWLSKIAITSLSSKVVSDESCYLSDIVVNSVLAVSEKSGNTYKIDLDDIKIEKKEGGAVKDTVMVQGIVLDKEVVHSGMPKKIKQAKIALVDSAFEIEKTEFDAKIRISSPEQIKQFMDEETNLLKEQVNKIKSAGANVVVCQKGIDDVVQHYFAKEGIMAVRRSKKIRPRKTC